MPCIDLIEACKVTLLATEQLHGGHAGDALLQKRVDPGDPRPHRPVGVTHVGPEPLRDQPDQWQHREGHQRQPQVHDDEQHHDANQGEDVSENRHHASREQVVQRVHVRGDACHEAPDRVAVVEAQVEPLQVAVHLHPDVEHDALPCHLQRPGLHVLKPERQHQRAQEQRRHHADPRIVPGGDVAVDQHLGEIGRRQLQQGVARDRHERHGHPWPVGAEVAHQPAHQTRVVGLAEDFLVVTAHEAASSSSSNCRRCRSA